LVFQNPVIKELTNKLRVLWALDHATALMGWDAETYMPREGIQERAIAQSELAVLKQKIILSPEIRELVEKAEKQEDLNDYEKGVIRVVKRNIEKALKVPPEVIAEYARISQEATQYWRVAKEKNDFSIFKPYLEKIVQLARKIADYLGWEEHPYDALLDLFEEGLRTRDVDRVFGYLEPRIRRILEKIMSSGKYPAEHELEKIKYDPDKLRIVNKRILEILGFPLGSRARLDESAHPFTQSMGIKDVRITTRYEGFDFKRSILSVVHEFGHALYQLQIDERLMATPIGNGVSLGIHEGQSRFWENIIGRSKEFVEVLTPLLKQYLDFLKDYDAEDIYYYFNTVRPSLIRTEADEVTYNLHILLRTKLEKQLLTGEIKVDELPEIWNQYMEELIGVRPRNYSEGILQDIHWSIGSIGYFPTYTLGNLVAAQMRHHLLKDMPDLYEKIRNKEYKPIQDWQREKIHKWGSTYAPKELLRKAFGEEYEAKYFIEYLEWKYLQ